MNKFFTICVITVVILFSACSSYKKVPYFQDLNQTTISKIDIKNFSPLTLQKGDVLGINVNSRNPESSSIFNPHINLNNTDNLDALPPGYLVDAQGFIQLPLIGNLKVEGLTTSELREKLNQMMLTYYKDPVVSIRILNFKISVLGDVQRPGIYSIQNERATLTQALTLAGDLNITAIRTITIIREQDGQRSYIPLDLTSKNIFESPYYYLKNGDLIYVQPDRTKYATVDRGYRTWTLVLSGLSIIAIVLSNLYRR